MHRDLFEPFMESLNKNAVAEAENNEAIAERVPAKKWVIVERESASEETDIDQNTPAEDRPGVEVAK